MTQNSCMKCARRVTRDEMGLTKKLINRGMETYFCMDCLAEHIGVSRRLLEEKVKQFKEMGCTLFR